MADIKVRDLTDTSSVALDNQIMVLTNDEQNQVQNITVENLLSNVLSSDNGNVLEQGTDGKLYVETPENITGDLADLTTTNKSTLVAAINEVDGDITTEATTRANADNNLQSQIDAITAASDVTDIVGTYAQLQAYDTTGLPDNSIIKVLQDESRQDETTYYRWVITGSVGAWVLIGEEGPYYTKSQADSLFATQQTTGNLASLDTSDKTSLVNAINELSSVLDPTQTADYINNSKAVESGAISSNSIILSDVIKYAHSTFDRSKFTVVGSPNITDDGIASGFENGNLKINQNITLGDDFELYLPFTCPSDMSTLVNPHQYFCRATSNSAYRFNAYCGSNGSAYFNMSDGTNSLGTPVVIPAGTMSANESAVIVIKQKNQVCTYGYIKDGIYTQTGEKTDYPLDMPEINNFYIGRNNTSDYFVGSNDLKYLKVIVNGVEVFSGNKTGIDTIKPDDYTVVGTPTISVDGVASGFSGSNYISRASFIPLTFSKMVVKCKFKISNYNLYSTMTNLVVDNGQEIKLLLNFNKIAVSTNNTICQTMTSISNWTPNVDYSAEFGIDNSANKVFVNIYNSDGSVFYSNDTPIVRALDTTKTSRLLIGTAHGGDAFWDGSIDLNAFKIYVDGDLVYQPCLKIPYTKGSEQYDGKYVNAQYLPRVKDAYEQGLANDYFTLDEANGTYTLPMGNLYGMIERLNQLAKDEIGLPKATLSNTLNDNEIWLEGAEVSKLTYSKLYAIYGDDYGTPTDSANFVLPDCRDRVMQGIGGGGTFGYIEAGLPNITGATTKTGLGIEGTAATFSGAFSTSISGNGNSVQGGSDNTDGYFNGQLKFNASKSNSIYGNSTTVQPPAIKVRFKTRFQ